MDSEKILSRGVEEIIEHEHLKARLDRGDVLRVKFGIDPTSPALHLGHAVVLRKLRQFQDAEHQAVLIIGDYTATIGDPSGRNELRPLLTRNQIQTNLQSYLAQAGMILNMKKLEIRYNSEWYDKKDGLFLMNLASKFTVAQQLQRDDFQKRIKEGRDISTLELLYPILQGYDSVEVRADVELGGTDQKFNLLMGRKVQKKHGLPEQDIMTLPIIEGLDGIRKMSKSYDNYIALLDDANTMFSKIMSIHDDLMEKYFFLLTDVPESDIKQLRHDRLHPRLASRQPKAWKEYLGTMIIAGYHGAPAAAKAQEEFEKVFARGALPEEMQTFAVRGTARDLRETLKASGMVSSKSEAQRLIEQGGVSVNGTAVSDWNVDHRAGDVIKVGPRRFLKIV